MKERIVVRRGTYHDSAFLMRVARELGKQPGMVEAVVVMGTEMNRELLAGTGFASAELATATPMDMVVALRGDDGAALDAATRGLDVPLGGREQRAAGGQARKSRDLTEAAAEFPGARLVSVSVPGAYAAFVAHRALDAGRHVFLFSNNVSVEDELALKRRGVDLGLLVMGPDCGTAIIGGVGLGFANRVPRGRIGIVGASGTGIQEVSCSLTRAGEGVSHAIGTGSQDLSAKVGGLMTEFGLHLLADDPGTEVIALIAKHPAEAVAERIHEVLRTLGKPAVVRYLGKPERPSADGVFYASTLDEAAEAAVALANGRKPSAADPIDETLLATRRILGGRPHIDGRMIGLFGGGSLAAEAKPILAQCGHSADEPDHPLSLDGPVGEGEGHLIIDTGEDFYTMGKPHPMVNQTVRCGLIRKAGADPAVGLLLIDLVLGDGAHGDPAPEVVEAVAQARLLRGDAPLVVVASVTGTEADPQVAGRQSRALAAADIHVQPTAARAALLSAALLRGPSECNGRRKS